MIERVAQRLRHRLGPGLKLLPVAARAGAVFLGDAVRAHGAPLVVIAVEPNRGKRPEFVVLRDLLGRQVAVVVDDRLGFGEALVEVASGVGLEQKIVVEHGGL